MGGEFGVKMDKEMGGAGGARELTRGGMRTAGCRRAGRWVGGLRRVKGDRRWGKWLFLYFFSLGMLFTGGGAECGGGGTNG